MKLQVLEQQAQTIISLSYKGEKKKIFEMLKEMKKTIEEIKRENA